MLWMTKLKVRKVEDVAINGIPTQNLNHRGSFCELGLPFWEQNLPAEASVLVHSFGHMSVC